MTTIILAVPHDTSQQEADRLLAEWQQQRRAGLKPEQRNLDSATDRDLSVIKQVMERS